MADTVNTNVIWAGKRKRVVQFTNRSDGTGESAVVKVDKSAITGPDGTEPTKIAIEKIVFAIEGMSVRLDFDHDTDDEIVTLVGQGEFDWTEYGGLVDPASAGGTGDILFTTNGHTAGDSYDITLFLRLKD